MAHLQQLHQRLFDPTAQRQVLQQLRALWPRLLGLLWEDPSPAVTAAAAPVVGAIGALAAQAAAATAAAAAGQPAGAAASGSVGGLLFDWLLPVLQRRATSGGHALEPHQLSAALLALRDCLAGGYARHAGARGRAQPSPCYCDRQTSLPSRPMLQAWMQSPWPAGLTPSSGPARRCWRTSALRPPRCQPCWQRCSRRRGTSTRSSKGQEGARQRGASMHRLHGAYTAVQRTRHAYASLSRRRARCQDLIDLALGWALEPALPDAARCADGHGAASDARWGCVTGCVQRAAACLTLRPHAAGRLVRRPALSRLLAAALGAQRRQQPGSAAPLLDSLLGDMQRFVAAAEQAVADAAADKEAGGGTNAARASLRQVLALAACVLPMLDAAAASSLPSCQPYLLLFMEVLQRTVLAVAAAAAASPALPAAIMAAELTGHVSRLAALAPAATAAAAAPSTSGGNGGGQTAEAATAALGRLVLNMTEEEHHPASAGSTAQQEASLQQLFTAVASFAAAAASQRTVLVQPAAPLALLAAVRSWLQMLMGQSVPLDAAAELLLPSPATQSAKSGSSWLLNLRAYGSKEVVEQAAQLLQLMLQHSPAALQALLADLDHQAAALGSTPGEATQPEQREPDRAMASAAAALQFDLCVLQAALPQLSLGMLVALWQQLLHLAQQPSRLADVPAVPTEGLPPHRQLLLQILQAAAEQLVASRHPGAVGVVQQALQLLTGLLDAHTAAPEQVILLGLQWLERTAEWPALPSEAHEQQAAAESRDQLSNGSPGLAAALAAAVVCADSHSAAVRAAALAAARALASTESGSTLLLRDAAAAASVYHTALLHLSDLDPAAAHAARELLLAAAAPLALAATLGDSHGSTTAAASEAAVVALQAQQLGVRPAHLRQLLDYIAGAGGPAAVLTAAGQAAAPPAEKWLPRLLHSMQAVPPPGSGSSSSISTPDW